MRVDQSRNKADIAKVDNAEVTVGQVATVLDTYERITRELRINGERGIRVVERERIPQGVQEFS